MDDSEANGMWEMWKVHLSRGLLPRVSGSEVCRVFSRPRNANEAIKLVATDARFRTAFYRMVMSVLDEFIHGAERDSDVANVLAAIADDEMAGSVFAGLAAYGTVEARARAVGALIRAMCSAKGRQWVRQRAARWWREHYFLEEERDAFIGTLVRQDAYRVEDLRVWGPTAEESAKRVAARARANGDWSWGVEAPAGTVAATEIGRAPTPVLLRQRTAILTQRVCLAVDARDSGLQATEIGRLPSRRHPQINEWPLLARAFERAFEMPFRHVIREVPWLAAVSGLPVAVAADSLGKTHEVAIPLLRLLHMRLLLESPSLSDALASPESFAVPEVVLFVVGQDRVTYSPELRVFANAERRWRARWAETSAEALSALILEDALALDLTTLSRIPERNDSPTPDFRAVTLSQEPIVFECKGSTAWNTHVRQRREALAQLGKAAVAKKGTRRAKESWAGNGRSFAVSLFAAMQGDERSSLLHVNDPPFAFTNLFGEGWEDDARRHHYAGALETAQLFDESESLLRRRIERAPVQAERATFVLDDVYSADGEMRFAGNFLPITDWLRRLRHPNREAFGQLRVFVGIEENRFRELAGGRLPRRAVPQSDQGSTSEGEGQQISTVTGFLPSREYPGEARGVYSLLSNGALLAVEIGP